MKVAYINYNFLLRNLYFIPWHANDRLLSITSIYKTSIYFYVPQLPSTYT